MDGEQVSDPFNALTALPFPALHKTHILRCSYHHWYPKLRAHTPKSRLIALSAPFLDYLRSDGIVLPPEHSQITASDNDSGIYSAASSSEDVSEDEEADDPSAAWPEVHAAVISTIRELGGKVSPKLNWSAPKDATWMSATNDLDCRSANDIYLLLKSSDFVTHDLEHAFDDCVDDSQDTDIPYHLVLRKSFNLNPSLEFRCFVREHRLLAICQRDSNYFEFLFPMSDDLFDRIEDFLEDTLLPVFGKEEQNFVFDVYIPPPHDRVWLIDINPWALRTDPLLFSWLELLTMPSPPSKSLSPTVRLKIDCNSSASQTLAQTSAQTSSDEDTQPHINEDQGTSASTTDEDELVEEVETYPIFRLVRRDDPEAYQFASTKYSAHKLPKDVVDASLNVSGPGGMNEIMEQWKKVMSGEYQQDQDSSDGG